MKDLKDYIIENWVDDIHKAQDDFKDKMVNEWKKNKDLKPFDRYFAWKTGKLDITKITKDEVQEMRKNAQELLDKLWDENNNEELTQIVEAIEGELLNMLLIGKIKK